MRTGGRAVRTGRTAAARTGRRAVRTGRTAAARTGRRAVRTGRTAAARTGRRAVRTGRTAAARTGRRAVRTYRGAVRYRRTRPSAARRAAALRVPAGSPSSRWCRCTGAVWSCSCLLWRVLLGSQQLVEQRAVMDERLALGLGADLAVLLCQIDSVGGAVVLDDGRVVDGDVGGALLEIVDRLATFAHHLID